MARVKKLAKWLSITIAAIIALFISLAIHTNVPTALTDEDIAVFRQIGLERINQSLSFEQEIALIRHVQAEVFKRAPMGEGIPEYQSREPADLLKFGQGLCFDRSRTFDKALSYLGFETRHVYLLYRRNKSFLGAFFKNGQPSHAVTEVKTSKGWMYVGSNQPWIAITRQGEPVNADDVWKRFSEFENTPAYLAEPWWAIRGLYSRKGQFYPPHEPYLIFPGLNWPTFLQWLVSG